MNRVIVVGLDGGTFDIIRPMVAEGRLKNLASLMSSGNSKFLESVIPTNSATAWNSFATGVNPAKHGVFDFMKRVEGSYSYAPASSRDRKARTVWQMASDSGLRCCVVNVPMTYPPEPVNGVMISGFPFPESKRDFAHPSGILDEIEAKTGVRGFLKPSPHFMNEGGQVELFDELTKVTRDQSEVVRFLMEKERWDLLVTVYDATDVAGHFFWEYMDKASPTYTDAGAAKYGDLLYRVYDAVDDGIGTIRSKVSPEDTVLVVSDHGFGRGGGDTVYVNNWLLRKGYLNTKRTAGTRVRRTLFSAGLTTGLVYRVAKGTGMVSSRTYGYSKKSARLGLAKSLTLSLADVDWTRTRAFARSTGSAILVNLKGREPSGTVEPGQEYDAVVAELKAGIGELRDDRTGKVMFDEVLEKSQLYDGPYIGDAADLFIHNSRYEYKAYVLFEFGSRRLVTRENRSSGTHRRQGILIAGGRGVAPGKLDGGARLLDMAPTILWLLGLPIPEDMDGRALTEVMAPREGTSPPSPPRTGEEGERVRSAAKRIATNSGI